MPIVIHRIAGGKITEQWGSSTSLSELRGQRLEQESASESALSMNSG